MSHEDFEGVFWLIVMRLGKRSSIANTVGPEEAGVKGVRDL